MCTVHFGDTAIRIVCKYLCLEIDLNLVVTGCLVLGRAGDVQKYLGTFLF